MHDADPAKRADQRHGLSAWFGAIPRALTPLDEEAALREIQSLYESAREAEATHLAGALQKKGEIADFLGAVLSLSPFLSGVIQRQPMILEALFETPCLERVEDIISSLSDDIAGETETNLMARLRRAKREAHALIGLHDLAIGDSRMTVLLMSRLADACIRAATRFLLLETHAKGALRLPDPANPEISSGLILLGMGKLGAFELNFSSDIDLIALIEPDAPAIVDRFECVELFARLIRRLVRILQERTGDGYVFRTDLRLRPDPGSTPLAIPVGAAMNYYEARGQNWERAAMIKARQVAGDFVAGERFLKDMRPYVWRKYMDFAAINDVHAIKRQIHAHRGFGEVAVRGHNVKLGRGGIREIEFFVQTQQLIAGGRYPELRGRETVAMLAALAQHRWITQEACDALTEAYWTLRDVEHRIQIVADEQTHILPEDDAGFATIAHLSTCPDMAEFDRQMRAVFTLVERHYAALFESEPEPDESLGPLIFTGESDNSSTLETLEKLGFERGEDISRIIRGWLFGRYRATRSAEARERLTRLIPALLEAMAETKRADDAMVRFDAFLSGLPAGVQLFSLLHNNPGLLKLLVTIMAAAPRLANVITRSPHVFDALLDPALLSELPNKTYLAGRLKVFLEGVTQHEEILDRLRIFNNEQRFLIGVRLLSGAIDAPRAGKAFSDLAELTIGCALDAVIAEFARRHGRVGGQRIAILALGKLGSRELSASSDVDLILLYDHDEAEEESDGPKPLASSLYFARLTQRLIAAVSAPTAEGILYELDLRLRPSGNKGPVATHIDAFRKYQKSEAWTWEHMALTRARAVAGDAQFCSEISDEIEAIIALPRDPKRIFKSSVAMRDLLEEEKPPYDEWDLKLIPGGLIDLEFIGQVASLCEKLTPSIKRPTSTADMLSALSPDFAAPDDAEFLNEAHHFYMAVTQVIRLSVDGQFERKTMPPGLGDLMLRVADVPDISSLDARIAMISLQVRRIFDQLLRAPIAVELTGTEPDVGTTTGFEGKDHE